MTGSGLSAQPSDTSTGHGASCDSRWLSAILRQYEGPLVLYTARITRDLERARDVVQEAFMRLLREDQAAIEPHLAEWLYTVCRNKALDVRRKEGRMTALTDTDLDLEPTDPTAPGDRLELQESAAKALRYVSRLPDNQQEVVRLKFQHGLSYKQISAITNLSVSNVGFLIHVALKTLRQRMGVR